MAKKPWNEPGDRFDKCLEGGYDHTRTLAIGQQIDDVMTKIKEIACFL